MFSADLHLERSKLTKLLGVKNKVVLNAVKRSSNSRKTRKEVPELEYDRKLAFNDCHGEGSGKVGNALSRPFPIPDWHIMHT